jgi:catechol 2,3-dioxygenase-like lactoylglutathione lyase family enzyme
MITGVHAIVYAKNAEKTRAFFRDVLGLPSVDAGQGWLIFALPPAEVAAHPAEGDGAGRHELFLMCDDIEKTVADLKGKGVKFSRAIVDRGWGLLATLKLPGGGNLSLYQPKHPTAIALKRPAARRRRAS